MIRRLRPRVVARGAGGASREPETAMAGESETPGGRSRARPSILLIREWEQQMSSSGCCGRLEGDFLSLARERCFPERRDVMEAMGPLYRGLRVRYGDAVEVHVVDPRNLGTLVALLVRDVRAHRPGLMAALGTIFRLSVTSVIVNGRLVARGRWPSLEEVSAALGDVRPTATGADADAEADAHPDVELAGDVA